MARQRVRAQTTWESAKAHHRALERKLARKTLSFDGDRGPALNTQEHWKDVGRYQVLEEILWDQDK